MKREVYEYRRMTVADQILAEPSLFHMGAFGSQQSCGTVACLAGTALLQAEKRNECTVIWSKGYMTGVRVEDPNLDRGAHDLELDLFACDYLGLTETGLFYRFKMTAEEAAKALLDAPYVEDLEEME